MQFQQFVASLPLKYQATYPNPGLITLFIAHLFDKGISSATITSKLSSLSYYCKLVGIEDHVQAFIVQKALVGVRKLAPSQDLRMPITLSILESLIRNTSFVTDSYYESIMLKAMLSLAFYGLLRPGEMTDSINNLYVHSLQLHSGHLEIKFYRFKHRQGPPIVIHISQQANVTCPVMLVKAYIAQRGRAPGPLFCERPVKPVTYRTFYNWFHNLVRLCNVQGTYNLHSFRVGGATFAAMKGMTDCQIKQLGRWRSSAYSGYIRMPRISL